MVNVKLTVLMDFEFTYNNCYGYIGYSVICFYTISQTSLLPFYAEIFLLKSQPFMWSERYFFIIIWIIRRT